MPTCVRLLFSRCDWSLLRKLQSHREQSKRTRKLQSHREQSKRTHVGIFYVCGKRLLHQVRAQVVHVDGAQGDPEVWDPALHAVKCPNTRAASEVDDALATRHVAQFLHQQHGRLVVEHHLELVRVLPLLLLLTALFSLGCAACFVLCCLCYFAVHVFARLRLLLLLLNIGLVARPVLAADWYPI